MKIVDTWKEDQYLFLYCIDEEIDSTRNYREAVLEGSTYAIEGYDIMRSLTGQKAVVIKNETGKKLSGQCIDLR